MNAKTIEDLAAQIHGIYCKYRKEVRGKPYWTGGDYSKLEEQTKEADRYMARFILERAEIAEGYAALEAKCAELKELLREGRDNLYIAWAARVDTAIAATKEGESDE